MKSQADYHSPQVKSTPPLLYPHAYYIQILSFHHTVSLHGVDQLEHEHKKQSFPANVTSPPE